MTLGFSGLRLSLGGSTCLLEEQDSLLEHEEVHEESFLLAEQKTILVFELDHLANLLVVVINCMVRFCPIDDETASILDILKSLERTVKVTDQFG